MTKFARHGWLGEVCVTKFALLAKKRVFWAVLRMQGEFCPDLATSKLSRESFVPRPGWRLTQNLWSAAVRCWDWLQRPGVNTHADR